MDTTQITYSTLSSNLHKLQKEKYIKEVNDVISESGDVLRLSNPDKKLIALALMLKDEGKNVKVVSDDYTIQNTLKIINIPYCEIITEGIKGIYNWKKVCEGCKKEFDESYLLMIVMFVDLKSLKKE